MNKTPLLLLALALGLSLLNCSSGKTSATKENATVYVVRWTNHTFRPLIKESFIVESRIAGRWKTDDLLFAKWKSELNSRPVLEDDKVNYRFGIINGNDTLLVSRYFTATLNGRNVQIDTCEVYDLMKIVKNDSVETMLRFNEYFECK